MAEDVVLSPEKIEKLLQFEILTGIDDMERCQNMLETHNWDVELATQATLNMQDGTPTVYRPLLGTPPAMDIDPPDQRVFSTTKPLQPAGIKGWRFMIIFYFLQVIYFTLARSIRYALNCTRGGARRTVTDPFSDVANFIEIFVEKYGTEHPIFHRGTYYLAVKNAKQDLKFLLVYLHDEYHKDTDAFCTRVLCDAQVVNFINANFLFWACSVSSPEGFRVSQALRANTHPFQAVVVLRDNRMTAVARLEGPTGPEMLIRCLQFVMMDNEASLVAARSGRTLGAVVKRHLDEASQTRKIQLLDMVKENAPMGSPSTIRLVVKFPSGTRIERRFSKDDSLKFLYYFVLCHAESPNTFELFTNFPLRLVPCEPTYEDPEPPTFEEFGLGNMEMVLVQP